MSSPVEIVRTALYLLGDESIINFDEESDRAKLGSAFYPGVRDEVLRVYPWNCADVRVQLVLHNDSPAFGYTYQFILPTAPYCLRVLRMEDSDTIFKIEGRKLLTSESTAYILYTARITDVNLFDPLLKSAIEARLAAKLAYPITSKSTMVETMWNLYKLQIEEAQTIDGLEGIQDSLDSPDLTEVR